MIRRITKFGEPILKQKGNKVDSFDSKLADLLNDMVETVRDAEGAGLAAQQVDKALQVFVMDIVPEGKPEFNYTLDGKSPPLDLIMPMAIVNPTITWMSDELYSSSEGCLSFPGIWLENVVRPGAIKMDFQDENGDAHTLECDGFLARCCLHEYDHLQGVLFIDRTDRAALRKVETKIKRLRRETRDWLKEQR